MECFKKCVKYIKCTCDFTVLFGSLIKYTCSKLESHFVSEQLKLVHNQLCTLSLKTLGTQWRSGQLRWKRDHKYNHRMCVGGDNAHCYLHTSGGAESYPLQGNALKLHVICKQQRFLFKNWELVKISILKSMIESSVKLHCKFES